MSSFSIFGLASSRGRADRIILDLKSAEFSNTEIGALFFDQRAENDHALEREPGGLTSAAAQSAGPIRGVLAWVAGIGRVVVSGAGSFIAAGPIMVALRQARNGTPGVAIARGLIHLGISATEAARFERRIKADGHILISVHTTNPNKLLRARNILAESNALDICTTADAAPQPASPAVFGASTPVSTA